MKAEKILILILLIFLTFGTVSAAEANTTSDDLTAFQESGIEDNPLESDLDDSLQRTDDANLSAGKGNFNDLSNIITNAEENSEIKLKKDYTYDKKTDSNYNDGIKIGKTLTINGQGHTIDGKDHPIFSIEKSNIVLKNIIFKNTHVESIGNNCQFVNCIFVSCHGGHIPNEDTTGSFYNGGAIHSKGKNCLIVNCSFQDCSVMHTSDIGGGAIYSEGRDCSIFNCSFINCFAEYDNLRINGGAIDTEGSNFFIANCSFVNCSAAREDAISSQGDNCSIINCNFLDCYGAIESRGENCNILVCTFENIYYEGNKAIDAIGNNCSVVDCNFVNYAVYFREKFNLINSSFINGSWYNEKPGNIFNVSLNNQIYDIAVFNNLKDNDRITLEKDYLLPSQIVIGANNIVIDGGEKSIMGNRLFIIGENVTIINCNFINSSGVSSSGINCCILSSNFTNCSSGWNGGAIYSEGVDCLVSDCKFKDCADKYSNAVHFEEQFTLANSSFINCSWHGAKPGNVSNVFIDGLEYDISIFNNIKENEKIILTKDYFINSQILINASNVVIDGCGNSIKGTGGFSITGYNVTIMNCNFMNCHNPLESKSPNCSIVNCSFLDCSANYYGGAIYSYGDNLNVFNCSFIRCSAGANGGAIYSHSINVAACNFINCSSDDFGDAIYFKKEFNLTNTSFINGAFYSEKPGNIFNVSVDSQIYDVSVFDNLKDNDRINLTRDYLSLSPISINVNNIIIDGQGNSIIGNRLFINGKNVTIINCNFINCTSEEESVIYSSGSNFHLINCTFQDCSVRYSVGVIYSDGDDSAIVNCSFRDCSGGFEGDGGAVYSHGNNFSLISSTFRECSADHTGGALYSAGSDCTVFNCSFMNCFSYCDMPESESSSSLGGAIYARGNNFNFTQCSFVNCTADNGGAIRFYSDNTLINGNIINCIFIDCSAGTGGAVSCEGCDFGYGHYTIAHCSFKDCSAGTGGAISLQGKFNLVNYNITGCSFQDCSASNGGAIYSCANDFYMNNCRFVNCLADKGGAFYNSESKCKIENSSFTGCSAKYDSTTDIGSVGGAIYSDVNCEIVNTTFKNCTTKPKIIASDFKMYYDDGSYYTVRIYGDDGNVASGVSVTFKLDGTILGSVKTDEEGYAKVEITSPPKTYEITITALGVSVTKKITVKKVLSLKTVKIKKSAKKLTLKSTLKNIKLLKGKTITFKFNGKKYTAKTNKKGVAKVTIKKSVLSKLKAGKKVKYSATYLKDTVKITAKVKK